MTASCIVEGAHGVTLKDEAQTIQGMGGKPGQGYQAIIQCYENHANDSRITREGQVTQTLNSRMGTGGGNLPIVLWKRKQQ